MHLISNIFYLLFDFLHTCYKYELYRDNAEKNITDIKILEY